MLTLTLYSRVDCHLCLDMQMALARLQNQNSVGIPFAINLIDVDSDDYLKLRYGDKVPVLSHGETEICHYHLKEPALSDYLRKQTT